MKVILLKEVQKVGRKYDIKNVADGFALNMLIPRGLAMAATEQAVKKIELMKKADTQDKKIQHELLLKNLEAVKNLKLNIKEKTNDKGHLFAGVGKEVLADEIFKSLKLSIDPEIIKLEKPIKEVGEHKITLVAEGQSVQFTVNIESI